MVTGYGEDAGTQAEQALESGPVTGANLSCTKHLFKSSMNSKGLSGNGRIKKPLRHLRPLSDTASPAIFCLSHVDPVFFGLM